VSRTITTAEINALPDDREHKLPVWAQDLIGGLRRSVRDVIAENAELRGDIASNAEAHAFIDPYDRIPVSMQDYQARKPGVVFGKIDSAKSERNTYRHYGLYHVKFDPETYELEIMGSGGSKDADTYRDSPLNVSPRSANVVTIALREHPIIRKAAR
jgi:hypothetical protein